MRPAPLAIHANGIDGPRAAHPGGVSSSDYIDVSGTCRANSSRVGNQTVSSCALQYWIIFSKACAIWGRATKLGVNDRGRRG